VCTVLASLTVAAPDQEDILRPCHVARKQPWYLTYVMYPLVHLVTLVVLRVQTASLRVTPDLR
jgi:hypothetical protein